MTEPSRAEWLRYANWAMLGLAAVLTLTLLAGAISRPMAHRRADALADRLAPPKTKAKPEPVAKSEDDTGKTAKPDSKKPATKPKESEAAKAQREADEALVKAILKRSIFTVKKTKSFSAKLTGVLGDQGIFNGSQLVKVGASVGGGKLLQLGPDWAEVEFEGKKIKQWVFGAGGSASPSTPTAGGKPSAPAAAKSRGQVPPGFKLTPEKIERFKQMPAEQRQQAFERMPPEIAEQLKKAIQ